MKFRKHGLRALGLTLMAALGLMAFSAAAAQAENLSGTTGVTHGTFQVLGANVTAALDVKVIGESLEAGFLLVAEKNVKINCDSADIIEGLLNTNGDAKGTILFLGCTILKDSNNEELKKCTETLHNYNSTTGKGQILVPVLILVITHTGGPYLLVEPPNNGTLSPEPTFVTLPFGGTCSLPANTEIKGSVSTKAPAAAVEPSLKIDTSVEPDLGVQTLLGDTLKFGVSPAVIKGSAKLKLLAPHAACSWGAA